MRFWVLRWLRTRVGHYFALMVLLLRVWLQFRVVLLRMSKRHGNRATAVAVQRTTT